MKRVDLVRQIERLGCVLVRHGAKHDWYRIRRPAFRSRFLAIARSRSVWRGTFCECFPAMAQRGGKRPPGATCDRLV
jgi:hypothetical protein